MDNLNNGTSSNPLQKEEIYSKEFLLKKDDFNYTCILKIKGNGIIIKIEEYEIELYLNQLQKLINDKINSLESFFTYFQDNFEKRKVYVEKIEFNKIIKLIFIKNLEEYDTIENNIELILIHKNVNKDYFINYLYLNNKKLMKDISDLNFHNIRLKQEMSKLKINRNNNIINKTISFSIKTEAISNNSPIYMQFYKNISDDSYAHFALENTFLLITSISNISYIIYSSKSKSIISQNIINFQTICEIKNAHDNYITNFRHFFDEKNRIDIIMSISAEDNNIKLWDLKNWICLKDIKKINLHGSLFSACFYQDKKEKKNLIITSNDNYSKSEKIKLIDFEGNKIKEINDSNHRTYFLDTFFDRSLNKYFIVTGIELGVISYDIEENKIYNQYIEPCEEIFLNDHNSLIVFEDGGLVKIIESCEDGFIRFWDFHTSKLLNKIEVCENKLYGICLWNKDFLFVGCDDNTLKLIELRKNFVINNIKTESMVINMRKINNAQYKDCLITQDWRNKIKIWRIKN